MNRLCQSVLVIASLVSLEGLSFAQTTALSPWTQVGTSRAARETSRVSFVLGDAIVLAPFSDVSGQGKWNDSTEAEVAADGDDAHSFVPPMAGTLAAARLCHISHHPRDGIRTALQACPLLVADADATVSSAPDETSNAIASRAVTVD